MTTVGQQLKPLLLKQWWVAKRSPVKSIGCYFFIPIPMIALFVFMVWLNFRLIDVTSYSSPHLLPLGLAKAEVFQDCIYRRPGTCSLAVAPNITSYPGSPTELEQRLIFSKWLELFNATIRKPDINLILFDSSEAMAASYARSFNFLLGVVLDASSYPDQVRYDIRAPSSELPTPTPPSKPSIMFPSILRVFGGAGKLMTSGFVPLQMHVDQAIGNLLATNASSLYAPNSIAPNQGKTNKEILAEPFSLKGTCGTTPTSNLVSVLPLATAPAYLCFAFFGIAILCSAEIVADRTSKVKEYLKIMGMKETSYWLVNMAFALIVSIFPLVALCVSSVVVGLFGQHYVIGLLSLVLLAISIIAYTMLAGALSPSAQAASGLCALLFATPFLTMFILEIPLAAKIVTAFIAPINFQYTVLELLRRKIIHEMGPVRELPDAVLAIPPYPLVGAIIMFIVDIILYSFLAWYFAQILGDSDSYGGAPKKWYFLFTRAYWSSKPRFSAGNKVDPSLVAYSSDDDVASNVNESTSLLLSSSPSPSAQDAIKPRNPAHFEAVHSDPSLLRICTRQLVKKYKGADTNAVDGLDLDIHQGIYVLLGENGSGKSTTISMLTGLIPHTSGSAEVDGADLDSQLDLVRSSISICPQQDLLSPNLSGAEHLRLFGLLKGIPASELEDRVADTLEDVGLTEKANELVKTYSGGMKRCLSLAIALIAHSPIVFIDEASSGMDIEKRRFLWDLLLRKKKEGSTLVLTTHYMEEAETLGDRIGIMHRGKLVREGSLDFLKRELGYQIRYSSPLNSSTSPPPHGSSATSDVPFHAPTKVQTLPLSERGKLPSILADLEKTYEHVSLSTPNLEEVFIALGKSLDSNKESSGALIDQPHQDSNKGSYGLDSDPSIAFSPPQIRSAKSYQQIRTVVKRHARMEMRNVSTSMCFLLVPILVVAFGLSISRISTNYMAQFPNSFLNVTPDLTPKVVSLHSSLPLQVPFTAHPSVDPSLLQNLTSAGLSFKQLSGSSVDTLIAYLWNGTDSKLAKLGGFQLEPNQAASSYAYTVLYNETDIFSASRLVTLMNTAAIRSYLGSTLPPEIALRPLISVRSVPLRQTRPRGRDPYALTQFLLSLRQLDAQFSVAICYVIAVLATIIGRHAVRDYETQIVPQLQRVGLPRWRYWLSIMIFECVRMTLSALIMAAVVAAFRSLKGPAFLVFLISILLQAWLMVPFTLVVSKLFNSVSTAQKILPVIFMVSIAIVGGFANGLLSLSSGKPGTIDPLSIIITVISLIVPPTLLINVVSAITAHAALGVPVVPSFVQLLIQASFSLGAQVAHLFIWILVLYVIERRKARLVISPIADEKSTSSSPTSPADHPSPDQLIVENIQDGPTSLMSEEEFAEGQAVEVYNLWKRYPKAKRRAVEGSTFCVPNGSCFGLLGPNGAGKSTTISMIIGDVPPSGGDYRLVGQSAIGRNRDDLYRQVRLACCLQTDSLFDNMTVIEHIHLYLELRNDLEDFDLDALTKSILVRMRLLQHAHKLAKQLSGGNKRKLCTAIATLIFADIVVLDEPSTGCDPSMRRTLWDVIRTEQAHKGLILTTHSMDEADAVCNRIAVMVNGQIVSMGTPAALKAQTGGYELQLWIPPSNSEQHIPKDVSSVMIDDNKPTDENESEIVDPAITDLEEHTLLLRFPSCTLIEKHIDYAGNIVLKYDIGLISSIAETYTFLHNAFLQGKFSDYSLSQTTLSTAYLRLVRHQLEEDAAEPDVKA